LLLCSGPARLGAPFKGLEVGGFRSCLLPGVTPELLDLTQDLGPVPVFPVSFRPPVISLRLHDELAPWRLLLFVRVVFRAPPLVQVSVRHVVDAVQQIEGWRVPGHAIRVGVVLLDEVPGSAVTLGSPVSLYLAVSDFVLAGERAEVRAGGGERALPVVLDDQPKVGAISRRPARAPGGNLEAAVCEVADPFLQGALVVCIAGDLVLVIRRGDLVQVRARQVNAVEPDAEQFTRGFVSQALHLLPGVLLTGQPGRRGSGRAGVAGLDILKEARLAA
jgi:hypothetical protein